MAMEKKDQTPKKKVGLSGIIKQVKYDLGRQNPDIIFDPNRKVEFVTSGCFSFDLQSGGGFPLRRISEIFGFEHSGKSSLLYAMFAANQKAGKIGILFDFEHSFHAAYAFIVFGLVEDGETFVVFQPDSIEEGDKILMTLRNIEEVRIVAFDSIEAMKPVAIIDGSLDKINAPGAQANSLSKFCYKLKDFAKDKNCAIVMTNQIRANIHTNQFAENTGIGAGFTHEDPYKTPGGFTPRFLASIRTKLEHAGRITDDAGENLIDGSNEKVRMGQKIKFINIKNKVHTPFLKTTAHFNFWIDGMQKGGWDEGADLMELLRKRGRIQQISTKFIYHGLNIKEWINVGPKVQSEALFMGDPKLIQDAKDLVLALLKHNDSSLLSMAMVEERDDPFELDDKAEFGEGVEDISEKSSINI